MIDFFEDFSAKNFPIETGKTGEFLRNKKESERTYGIGLQKSSPDDG